ncbi:hypothetical protein B0I03_1221 [Flavobacterium aquaticum]|uniref:Uncharacterized protein n=1 Tax=Flavobacterium aquaticum TaxID=1236486 RepID=A0A327YEN4_9FLAO|nr:hypothetical protein [Flavobacterium aquaticum]RAK18957.1 hypothetical protein B0I03_1221 [Flavobacterium aquaticum]
MNYDFFANKEDKIEIIEFILKNTDLRIFDSYSEPESEIKEYKTIEDFNSKLNIETEIDLHFQLWNKNFGRDIEFERIELNPKYCNGKKYRFATRGFGLIQLYFGKLEKNVLSKSHIGHFNEKGAKKWENIGNRNEQTEDWNWIEIAKNSRKLQYEISKKLAVKKVNSYEILKGAESLQKKKVTLWGISE